MRTVEYGGEVATLVRSHPWTTSASEPGARYLDLRAQPALIRTALEDFVAWGEHPAIEAFYQLLEWLAGPSSLLESSDCAFSPPHREADRVGCEGRLMVLYRDLACNLDAVAQLARRLHVALAPIDAAFEDGVIGTAVTPVRYRDLDDALGSQLMVSFWAWGDSEAATMAALHRVITNLSHSLRQISAVQHP